MTSTEHDTGDLPQVQIGDPHTSARVSPRPSGPVSSRRVFLRAARRDTHGNTSATPGRHRATIVDLFRVLAALASLLVFVALLGFAIATWLGF